MDIARRPDISDDSLPNHGMTDEYRSYRDRALWLTVIQGSWEIIAPTMADDCRIDLDGLSIQEINALVDTLCGERDTTPQEGRGRA